MNKIINDLLNSNARVIIPEFGAFIIKQKSPKLVVFNEFLRYNDGLLIDYISASETIAKDTAKEKVVSFVEGLHKKLSEGEEIAFEGIGKLVKESSGKISLIEFTASDLTPPKKEKKTSSEKESKSTADTPKKDLEEVSREGQKKETVVEKSEPESLKKEEKKVEEKSEHLQKEEKEEIEITLDKEEKKPSQPEKQIPAKDEKITVTPIITSHEQEKNFKPFKEEKPVQKTIPKPASKKNSLQIIIWILLIIIVNSAIVAWFVFNDEITGFIKKDKKPKSELTTSDEVTGDDMVEENSEDMLNFDVEPEVKSPDYITEPVQETKTSDVIQPGVRDKKQYYIVAGCFSDENNADKMVVELKKNGYNGVKFGKIGNLHAVSFSSYAEKSAALEELKNLRNAGFTDAWIIFY